MTDDLATEVVERIKKIAESAAKAAQEAMSDKAPRPIELGGGKEKLPKPGTVISPPPISAPEPPVSPGGENTK